MGDLEDEIKVLREQNNELVQKVQYWKMTAAQRDNEKLELMKEINQLRLKLSRIRSGGATQARKLEADLQATSEEALSHLVQASSAVARSIELTKQYMQERQELETLSPRWSTLSGAPTPERVNKVPPLMIGGRSLQPVVALRRSSLGINNSRSTPRSPNHSRNVTQRAVPMHMLQDVYIPLTRIDPSSYQINYMESEGDTNEYENSTENLEETAEQAMDTTNNSSDNEEYDNSCRLDAVTEEVEPNEEETTPPRLRADNPLEGPSWLLDAPTRNRTANGRRRNLEPDSTTLEENPHPPSNHAPASQPPAPQELAVSLIQEFSPTIRRRKRTASPPTTPTTHTDNGRVLKVVVAKMQLQSPPVKRAAPSPHGATDTRLIVLESSGSEYGGGDTPTCSPLLLSKMRPSRDGCSGDEGNRSTTDLNLDTTLTTDGTQNDNAVTSDQTVKDTNTSEPTVICAPNTVNCVPNAVTRDSNVTTRSNAAGDAELSLVRQAARALTLCGESQRTRDRRSRSRDSCDSRGDSDSDRSDRSDLRTRRNRKPVVYKEKPLNCKLRR